MGIQFGREICSHLTTAESREWLVTNGIGGYACGTVAGLLTRRYHGLLIAALKPPLGRTLLLTKIDEIAQYGPKSYPLYTNRWVDDIVGTRGFEHLEQFRLEGTIPVWTFACGDALLEKRVWMQQGENTTYIQYSLVRATQPMTLKLKALINYRDHHSDTQSYNWQMDVEAVSQGIKVVAFPDAVPFYLLTDRGSISIIHDWYYNFYLVVERDRGLIDHEDHLHIATVTVLLQPGESITLIASTQAQPNLDSQAALLVQHQHEQALLEQWQTSLYLKTAQTAPDWIRHLILAADQFIVDRTIPTASTEALMGKTIIAGYPWFGDWGRDTMISLPGLAIATGRPEIARPILHTFAQYLDRGMLPNLFPEAGETPEYNTVDAILWYFEAIRAYYRATGDIELIRELFPALVEVIEWHRRGTRYQIHLDFSDGLIYAGEEGSQLTWMDAKVGNQVFTPRIGKPIEISALWYNALGIMAELAKPLDKPYHEYEEMARQTAKGFNRFWNPTTGYCYDVLDSPLGNDATFRPNQIFAVSLPNEGNSSGLPPLLTAEQRRAIVDRCARSLLTSHGLRSLSADDPQYQGHYGGDPLQRDSAYHQGTAWGWLLGPFVQAHWRVYGDRPTAQSFLHPMANHLLGHCVGSLSEIFDGDAPMTPRGTFAQAWTVAEVLRAWTLLASESENS